MASARAGAAADNPAAVITPIDTATTPTALAAFVPFAQLRRFGSTVMSHPHGSDERLLRSRHFENTACQQSHLQHDGITVRTLCACWPLSVRSGCDHCRPPGLCFGMVVGRAWAAQVLPERLPSVRSRGRNVLPRGRLGEWGLMRHYYTVDAIRAAEAPLLARLPDGALMRRAAYPLSIAVARELLARTGGVAGRRICAVVGSGDNGGDALWASTFLRHRGAAAAAVLLNPDKTHKKGLAAFKGPGGRG